MKCRIYVTMFLSVLMSACSPTEPERIKISDFVGLWNSSENVGNKTDVIYTRVSSDGSIIEYDFDGDEVDNGLSCYQIVSGSIAHVAENGFLVTVDMQTSEPFAVELELLDDGHALKIYFLDSEDKTKTLKSQIWTREADGSILDNEPSCR